MSSFERGDRVFYIHWPTTPLTVISDVEMYGGRLVVECKWLPPRRRVRYEFGLFDVTALRREPAKGSDLNQSGKAYCCGMDVLPLLLYE